MPKTPPISTILFSVLLFLGSAFIAFLVITSNFSVEVNKFFAADCPDGQFQTQEECDNACGAGGICFYKNITGCYRVANCYDGCPTGFNSGCDGGGGGDGDGGGSCDQAQLSASFSGGSVTITNNGGGGCDVHATSWEVYDRFMPEFLATQERVSAPIGRVNGHSSLTLEVSIPNCSHQVDAGVGSPPSNANYGSNYIDGRITFTDYLCDGTCIGESCQPTPVPTTPPPTTPPPTTPPPTTPPPTTPPPTTPPPTTPPPTTPPPTTPPPTTPPPAELICAPATQNATSGQQVAFTASGGRSPYVWGAPGGSPSSSVGNPFTATFTNTTTTPRTFTATVTDQDGRTDSCDVTVSCSPPVCTPPSGCSYQGGNACACGTLVCPSAAPLVCAPANQTVAIGQAAVFQAGGGTGPYTWTAPGSATFSPNGQVSSGTYSSAGSYTVTVRDSQNRTAFCAVIVPATATPPPPTTPALTIAKTVRNVTANGPDTETANADPGHTVEFTVRVSSVGTGTATQVTVRDSLPSGLNYQAGTTTIDGVAAADGITGSGISLGDMVPGRTIVIRFRAVVADASFFPNGTTTLVNTAFARGSNTAEVSDNAQVRIVRGTTTPTQVSTGPGESAILALVISAIATLLYVGYASTSTFTRHEAESLARKGKDDIDSLNFRR